MISREPVALRRIGDTARQDETTDSLSKKPSKEIEPGQNSELLAPGHFVLMCPKANRNELSALIGSLSSSLTLVGGSFGRNRQRGGVSGLQVRIDGLLGAGATTANTTTTANTITTATRNTSGTTTGFPRMKNQSSSPTSVSFHGSLNSLTVNTHNPAPHTWHFGHSSAAVVNFGIFEVTAGVSRVQPAVYFDGSGADPAFCVFQGYLSNLEELLERYDVEAIVRSTSRLSPGEKAAALLYAMVHLDDKTSDSSSSSDPLVVLSELQGQYAFVMYNSDRKQVFGARDSSGKERLFYELDDDNGVTVTNTREVRVRGVDGVGWVEWEELQPGHYICGRPVKVNQFGGY